MGAIAPILAGCGGTGEQTFDEKFEVNVDLFDHVRFLQETTDPNTLPTGGAVYTGIMGMDVDVDRFDQPEITDPLGDFRAAGEFTINVDFGVASTLSGTITNFTADENHDLSCTLTIPLVGFTGSTFDATYSGDLTLDGFDLFETGGTTIDAQFKGDNGEFIWGSHTATIDWAGSAAFLMAPSTAVLSGCYSDSRDGPIVRATLEFRTFGAGCLARASTPPVD